LSPAPVSVPLRPACTRMMSVAGSSMRMRAPLSVCRSQPCTPSPLALAATERRLPTGSAWAGMDASINAGNRASISGERRTQFSTRTPNPFTGRFESGWADSRAAIRKMSTN